MTRKTNHVTASGAALRVVRAQCRTLWAHEGGVRAGNDPEELHDMRVATRRLRAVLALFRQRLPERAAFVRQELGWLGRLMGAARDLDVRMALLTDQTANVDGGDQPALEPLWQELREQRGGAQQALVAALDSPRCAALRDSLAALAEHEGADNSPALTEDGPRLLLKRWKRLRQAGANLRAAADEAELHAVRLRAKRLRYAVEAVSPALPGKRVEPVLSRLADLQDVLGRHRDAVAAASELETLVETHAEDWSAETLAAIRALRTACVREARRSRSRVMQTYRRARGRPWRRLRRASRKLGHGHDGHAGARKATDP